MHFSFYYKPYLGLVVKKTCHILFGEFQVIEDLCRKDFNIAISYFVLGGVDVDVEVGGAHGQIEVDKEVGALGHVEAVDGLDGLADGQAVDEPLVDEQHEDHLPQLRVLGVAGVAVHLELQRPVQGYRDALQLQERPSKLVSVGQCSSQSYYFGVI